MKCIKKQAFCAWVGVERRILLRPLAFGGAMFIVSMAAFSPITMAEQSGVYVGIGIGSIEAQEGQRSSKSSSASLIAGYRFNRYLASEFSLVDVGNHTAIGMEGRGVGLSLLGEYPFSDTWSVFAKWGGLAIKLKVDENITTRDSAGEETLKDGIDPGMFYAYGLKYSADVWSWTLENARADTDADLSTFSLNAFYHF